VIGCGALSFWLDVAGVEVWMSDYKDVIKPAGANAFEGFESIRQAGFYILLGGEKERRTYSGADGISVTQQEYREAFGAFQVRGRR
jgi:hypothetical protein